MGVRVGGAPVQLGVGIGVVVHEDVGVVVGVTEGVGVMVGVGMGVRVGVGVGGGTSVNLLTKASSLPPTPAWYGFSVGKSVELVYPVT